MNEMNPAANAAETGPQPLIVPARTGAIAAAPQVAPQLPNTGTGGGIIEPEPSNDGLLPWLPLLAPVLLGFGLVARRRLRHDH